MRRNLLALCLLVTLCCFATAQQVEYAKPWDKGVNICAYLVRPGVLDYKICPYCLPFRQEYAKGMMDFKYDCCPGFKRTPRFDNQCVERERTWKLIPGLLKDHGVGDFSRTITSKRRGAGHKTIDDAKAKTTHTVIAPYSSKVFKASPVNYDNFKGNKNHPILYHVLKGRIYMRDFRNGMLLPTEYGDEKLKVTKYSNGIICIECRVLVEPDHEARNGVVHYFSGMMAPSISGRRTSVMDLLEQTPDTQEFAKSIPDDLRKLLSSKETCNWYTVFAPNNDLWRPIRSKDPEMAKEIARNHVLRRGMYCSAAIISLIKKLGPTFANEYLTADCDAAGQRMVRSAYGPNARITKADQMACNGVVHLVDNVLMPSKGLSLRDALTRNKNNGNNDWIRYMEQCDLRMQPNRKYAVLIPTVNAFNWWMNYARFQKYYQRFQTDADFRCRLIRFHIFEIKGDKATNLEYLWLQQEGYRTNNIDRLWEVDYFMKMYYGSQLYFHYSPVDIFRSYQFQDGSIYFIDRVNMIPEKNIIDILPTRNDFSTTYKLTQLVKMHQNTFVKNRPLNLYLVVRNGGYSGGYEGKMVKTLTTIPTNARNFLLLHWVPLYLWGGDIGYFENGTRHRFMSGLKTELIFDREKNGTMFIGYEGLPKNKWAIVVEWNIFAIDGMIWVLDRGLECPGKLCKKKVLEVEVWKVLTFACWESLRVRRGARGKEMEPWLDRVNGDQCLLNREVPKSEKSEHGRRY